MKSLWKRMDLLDGTLRKERARLLALLKENPRLEVRDLRFPIFSLLCDALYDAAKEWHRYQKDFPFYLWPGYDTIRVREGEPQRVQLRVPVTELLGTGGRGRDIACGISPRYPVPHERTLRTSLKLVVEKRLECLQDRLPYHDKYRTYFDPGLVTWDPKKPCFRILTNPTSYLFNVLLTGPETSDQSSEFIPGSTHRWLSEFDPIAKRDGTLPRGLIVNYATGATRICSNSFLSVNLKRRLDNAGPEIGRILDRDAKAKAKWPVVLSGSNQQKSHLHLRRQIYTHWLMAVFAPERATDSVANAERLLTAILNADSAYLKWQLGFLEGTVQSLREVDPSVRRLITQYSSYRHWYSLALDSAPGKLALSVYGTLDRTAQVPLGTVMLFSRKPLDQAFLTLCRSWIQDILLLLRDSEGSVAAVETGELKQAFDQYSAMSHELKDLTRLIPLAKDREDILEGLRDAFLTFSLPAASKLNESKDRPYFPPAVCGNVLIALTPRQERPCSDYHEWLSQLVMLAAKTQAIAIPGIRGRVVDSLDRLTEWQRVIANRFEIHEELKNHELPRSFEQRCFLAVAILCALRNIIKHAFGFDIVRDPKTDQIKAETWTYYAAEKSIYIGCCFEHDQRFIQITNPHNGTPTRGNQADGTQGAIGFYLNQIGDRMSPPRVLLHSNIRRETDYRCLLPMLE